MMQCAAMNPFLVRKPVLDPGLKDSTVLWRYLDTASFFNLLHTEELYLCRGDLFEDKFEGAFTSTLKAAIEEAYSDNHLLGGYDAFRKMIRENVYINCWHANPHDNMAMWGLYGKSPTSVAITTTVGKLRDALEIPAIGELSIRKVKYTNHWRDPAISIFPYSQIFTYKVKAYAYEKEVRVMLDRTSGPLHRPDTAPGVSVKTPLNKLLRSVVLAPNAPIWFCNLIRETAIQRGLTAPVRNSKMASDPI